MALGGRVAESLTFNKITTGAQNDLQKVTKMAYAQVRVYGMSEAVGLISFPEEEIKEIGRRPYSKRLTALMDEEAQRLVAAAYLKTEQVLKDNKEKLELVSAGCMSSLSISFMFVHSSAVRSLCTPGWIVLNKWYRNVIFGMQSGKGLANKWIESLRKEREQRCVTHSVNYCAVFIY